MARIGAARVKLQRPQKKWVPDGNTRKGPTTNDLAGAHLWEKTDP